MNLSSLCHTYSVILLTIFCIVLLQYSKEAQETHHCEEEEQNELGVVNHYIRSGPAHLGGMGWAEGERCMICVVNDDSNASQSS